MDATQMHVMLDIKDTFKAQGKGTTEIADLLHKDNSVVAKQFAEKNGSQTLLTAYGYAEAAGGRIVFMLDDEWNRLHGMEQEIHDLKDELRDRDNRLTVANESISAMTREIEKQHDLIQKLETRIKKKEEKIEEKERIIERKDSALHQLLFEKGVLKE